MLPAAYGPMPGSSSSASNTSWSLRAGVEHGRTTDYRDNVQVTGLEPDGRTVRRNYTVVPGSYNTAAAFADVRGEFDFHLHGCQSCVNHMESYRATIDLTRAACGEDVPAPDDAPESLVQAILAARKKL